MWTLCFMLCCLFAPPKKTACEGDVEFALVELEKRCGHFFESKGVDWKQVATEMRAAAKAAKTESDHYGTLLRLLARLRDGHAEVIPVGKVKDVKPPADLAIELLEPSFHLCCNGSKLFVKTSWGKAESDGLKPGAEVTSIQGKPAGKWLTERIAYWRARKSFSTEQHATAFALTRGLAVPRGEKIELKTKSKAGAKSFQFGVNSDDGRRVGPALPLAGGKDLSGLFVGRTGAGFGYVYIPKVYDDLPKRLDAALGELAGVKGLILDFRGNTGGGCDHDAVLGLFVPQGETMTRPDAGPIASTGEHPFGGNVVVIVDAMVVSAGETVSGMFKEDGRGYLIGESATAGMSGSKEDLELPSGLFQLHFVVRSNKARFQGGKGIEGIGIMPYETLAYDPVDLEKGVDTLTARAEAILADFPRNKVRYSPSR